MSERLAKSVFEPHVHTNFRIHVEPDVVVEVELVEARDLPPSMPNPELNLDVRSDPFSLVFEGPRDSTFEQGSYKFVHEGLGELEIFVVPIGWGRFEAVFN